MRSPTEWDREAHAASSESLLPSAVGAGEHTHTMTGVRVRRKVERMNTVPALGTASAPSKS